MTDNDDGVEHRDARIAEKILTYAQALIAGRVPFDLRALERRYGVGSVFIDLPIGEEMVASLDVRLHPPERTAALKREALYLAETVKDCARKAPDILRDAERVPNTCQDVAQQAREAGVPITVGRIRIGTERSGPGCASACPEAELLFVGVDLDEARWWSRGNDVYRQREAIAVAATIAAPRMRMKEALARHGAVCPIDPIAYAAMRHFGITVEMLLDSLSVGIFARRASPLLEQCFIPVWRDGVVHADFELASDIGWWRDMLRIRRTLPATMVDAAPGRAVTDIVDHPVLRGATIARAEGHARRTELTIRPLAPLLLLPDGSAISVSPDEAAVPRAEWVDDGDPRIASLGRQLIGLSGMTPTFEEGIGP